MNSYLGVEGQQKSDPISIKRSASTNTQDSNELELVGRNDKKQVASKFDYMLMRQLKTCFFSENDRHLKKKKDITIGYPGIICKHCGAQKWFPKSKGKMITKTFVDIYKHLGECEMCPKSNKDALVSLRKDVRDESKQSEFYNMIWDRIHKESKEERKLHPSDTQISPQNDKSCAKTSPKVVYKDENEEESDDNTLSDKDSDYSATSDSDDEEFLASLKTRDKAVKRNVTGRKKITRKRNGTKKLKIPISNSIDSEKTDEFGFRFKKSSQSWVCRKCITLPSQFKAQYSTFSKANPPTVKYMRTHAGICTGRSPNIENMIRYFHGIIDTRENFRKSTFTNGAFTHFISALVGDEAKLRDFFTTGLRKLASGRGGKKYGKTFPSCPYPAKVNREDALRRLALLTREGIPGISIDIVENIDFIDYIALVAPGYELPSQRELMDCNISNNT